MWTTTSQRARHLERGSYVDRSGDAVRVECARELKQLRERLGVAAEEASRFAARLREGDHRIKNSLQLVSGLVALQAKNETSDLAREALNQAAGRIMSVARVHDALQLNPSGADLDMGMALKTMCQTMDAMAGDPGRIDVRIDIPAEPVFTSADLAQPVMLIVNELLINALKHGFPDGRAGAVSVRLVRAGRKLHITVADDGVGLPDGYAEGGGFGMNLVRMSVRQIAGKLTATSGRGATFALEVQASGS